MLKDEKQNHLALAHGLCAPFGRRRAIPMHRLPKGHITLMTYYRMAQTPILPLVTFIKPVLLFDCPYDVS